MRWVHFAWTRTTPCCFVAPEPVALGRRGVALLCALVERPGALVSNDVLIEAAWTGQAVEDSNLTVVLINREFRRIRLLSAILKADMRANSDACSKIPYSTEQGIFAKEQVICTREQGI